MLDNVLHSMKPGYTHAKLVEQHAQPRMESSQLSTIRRKRTHSERTVPGALEVRFHLKAETFQISQPIAAPTIMAAPYAIWIGIINHTTSHTIKTS